MTAIRAASSDGRNGHPAGGGYVYGGTDRTGDSAQVRRRVRQGQQAQAPRRAAARERKARFAALMAQGMKVEDAAAELGITVSTAYRYERERAAGLAGEGR